ncbi:MAG: carboxylesterase/lipase family protein [Acidimicrobiales bacterium]
MSGGGAVETIVKTVSGAVRGVLEDGVAVFRGIPYAAAPFGTHRFRAPERHGSWEGVRDATTFGPTAPKPPYPAPFDQLLPEVDVAGEDCLNLNVWTPDPGASGLPVLVWIHGGAFVNGSGSVAHYDGRAFARDGVVCVTINYRLGVDGFLVLDGAPPNRGLLDQVAALEWVQDNIAAFGGDPATVTIAGESAGAMSVTTLLSMPSTAGLFRRAVPQSGAGHHALSAATARLVTAELSARLGVQATVRALAEVPLDRLIEAQAALSGEALLEPDPARWGEAAANGMLFEPVIDGEVLPALPIDGVAAGHGRGVDLLAGTNRDEYRLFLVLTGVADLVDDDALTGAAAGLGMSAAAVGSYRRARPDLPPGLVLSALMTDWVFLIPAVRLAEAHQGGPGSTHLYEFAWPATVLDGQLGACHALEIGFVFDSLDVPGGDALYGPGAPRELATTMHRAWVDFVTTGDPGWAPYDLARRTTMVFDVGSRPVDDPAGPERAAWGGSAEPSGSAPAPPAAVVSRKHGSRAPARCARGGAERHRRGSSRRRRGCRGWTARRYAAVRSTAR